MSRSCPTPNKARFRDRIAAELRLSVLRGQTAGPKDVRRAYRCKCGAWHLTSKK